MATKAEELRHVAAMKKAGVPEKYVKEEAAEAAEMKRGGRVRKFGDGGSTAGAGRGFVNPPRVKSDAEKEAMQAAQDEKDRKKIAAMGYAKGGRVKRYDDGGEVDPMEAANASAESQDIAASVPAGPKAEPVPELSFKEAFAEARAEGLKTFMWRGKKFTTDMGSSSKGGSGRGKINPTTEAAPAENPNKRSIYSGSVVDTLGPDTKAAIARNQARRTVPVEDPRIKARGSYSGMGMAKGGSVKGWGEARGARAAKIT